MSRRARALRAGEERLPRARQPARVAQVLPAPVRFEALVLRRGEALARQRASPRARRLRRRRAACSHRSSAPRIARCHAVGVRVRSRARSSGVRTGRSYAARLEDLLRSLEVEGRIAVGLGAGALEAPRPADGVRGRRRGVGRGLSSRGGRGRETALGRRHRGARNDVACADRRRRTIDGRRSLAPRRAVGSRTSPAPAAETAAPAGARRDGRESRTPTRTAETRTDAPATPHGAKRTACRPGAARGPRTAVSSWRRTMSGRTSPSRGASRTRAWPSVTDARRPRTRCHARLRIAPRGVATAIFDSERQLSSVSASSCCRRSRYSRPCDFTQSDDFARARPRARPGEGLEHLGRGGPYRSCGSLAVARATIERERDQELPARLRNRPPGRLEHLHRRRRRARRGPPRGSASAPCPAWSRRSARSSHRTTPHA